MTLIALLFKALRQELERLHEQALNLAAAHRRDAMGGRAESCARCRKPIEGAAEDALLVLQCHNGHPTCPDCRMAQDGLGRLVVANCSVCGGGVVFRYRAKPYLAPLMVSSGRGAAPIIKRRLCLISHSCSSPRCTCLSNRHRRPLCTCRRISSCRCRRSGSGPRHRRRSRSSSSSSTRPLRPRRSIRRL